MIEGCKHIKLEKKTRPNTTFFLSKLITKRRRNAIFIPASCLIIIFASLFFTFNVLGNLELSSSYSIDGCYHMFPNNKVC